MKGGNPVIQALLSKLKESLTSVLPVFLIVLVLSFTPAGAIDASGKDYLYTLRAVSGDRNRFIQSWR